MSKSVFLSPATKGTRDLTEAASPKISLSPIEFSKGLLAKLSVLRAQKPGFFSPEEKRAAQAIFDVCQDKVSRIKGDDAKSPRYRELLRLRNTFAPGVMDEYGGFRHAMFQALGELRETPKDTTAYPLAPESAMGILARFRKDDVKLIEECANAYTQSFQVSRKGS